MFEEFKRTYTQREYDDNMFTGYIMALQDIYYTNDCLDVHFCVNISRLLSLIIDCGSMSKDIVKFAKQVNIMYKEKIKKFEEGKK